MIRPEPYRCRCRAGDCAHPEHVKPLRVSGAHLEAGCKHSLLRDHTMGYPDIRRGRARRPPPNLVKLVK